MQAIEFTVKIQDGVIFLPKHHKDWFKKSVRIILLAQEPTHALPIEPDTPLETDTWLGCMSNSGQILGDIVSPINDNLNCWEVLAK
jgi:hypothetical protein